MLRQLQHVHRLPAPAHQRVLDALVFDHVGRISRRFGDGLGIQT